jgi:hypothetical protein
VRQLQLALDGLGLLRGHTGRFDAATKLAVEALYRRAGYDPPTTDDGNGSDAAALDQAQDVLDRARMRLAEALAEASRAGQGGGSPEQAPAGAATDQAGTDDTPWPRGPDEPAEPAPSPPATAVVEAFAAVNAALLALDRLASTTGVTAPLREIVFVPELPAHVVGVTSDAAGGLRISLTTQPLTVVTPPLTPEQRAALGRVSEATPLLIELLDAGLAAEAHEYDLEAGRLTVYPRHALRAAHAGARARLTLPSPDAAAAIRATGAGPP